MALCELSFVQLSIINNVLRYSLLRLSKHGSHMALFYRLVVMAMFSYRLCNNTYSSKKVIQLKCKDAMFNIHKNKMFTTSCL